VGPRALSACLVALAAGAEEWNTEPPEPVEGCEAKLAAAGVRFQAFRDPLRPAPGGRFRCGVEQGAKFLRGPGGIRYNRPPRLSCAMALALARFETVVQDEAKRWLGRPVERIVHAGTYACREMAAYPGWVSEHAWANAIDIDTFVLRGGREVSASRYAADDAAGHFLRALARRLVDEHVFSVVLTPRFDRLHRNHLHLDLARYQVDGT
jgi:hypothetical protein